MKNYWIDELKKRQAEYRMNFFRCLRQLHVARLNLVGQILQLDQGGSVEIDWPEVYRLSGLEYEEVLEPNWMKYGMSCEWPYDCFEDTVGSD